jgi:hypothetical protein
VAPEETMLTLKYYGIEGTGCTVTEAKKDAGAKIEKALSGSYRPIVLAAGGETIICWRNPEYGWSYGWLRDGDISGTSSGRGDREDCECSARRHIGMNATDWRTCLRPEDVDPIVKEAADRREIAQMCAWQRDYHRAIAAGLDDNDARNLIGGFPTRAPLPESLKDWKPESR